MNSFEVIEVIIVGFDMIRQLMIDLNKMVILGKVNHHVTFNGKQNKDIGIVVKGRFLLF